MLKHVDRTARVRAVRELPLPLSCKSAIYLADIEYTAGLATRLPGAFIQSLPPEMRPGIQSQVWKYALPLNPFQRPLLIRAIAKPARHGSQKNFSY